MFDAEHLFRIGLINKIFDNSDELEVGANLFVRKLAALDPTAVKMTKETQRATTGMPITDALVMAKHLNALLMSSGRIKEAAEFFEKNKKSKS
jgi:enoyl-CoA hydratase/carnithine racemase